MAVIIPLTNTDHWWPKEFRTILLHNSCLFRAQFFPLPWCSISCLICVKRFVIIVPRDQSVQFSQIKLSISMTSLITFSVCLAVLSLLVYFLDHLWMTSILFDVNICCRFFSISKLVSWVISDPVVHNGLNNTWKTTIS